jgi:hypothetical protein
LNYIFEKVQARQEESISLNVVQPVIRSEADMVIPLKLVSNGGSGDHVPLDEIPSPEPKKSDQPERAPSQQKSSFDLKSHPNNEPHPIDSPVGVRNSPKRASVRVRAPPGGRSSGGFW